MMREKMACRAVCGCSLCTEMKDYRGSEIPSVSSYLKIGREVLQKRLLGGYSLIRLGMRDVVEVKNRLVCCFEGLGLCWSPLSLYLKQEMSGAWLCSPWLCCVGAGGSALQGTAWVAEAGVFPFCSHVPALASPGSQEQTCTEGHICLINDFLARPTQ